MTSCSCGGSCIARTLGASPCRIFAICISMDEQLADAWNAFTLCHSTLGHISGTFLLISYKAATVSCHVMIYLPRLSLFWTGYFWCVRIQLCQLYVVYDPKPWMSTCGIVTFYKTLVGFKLWANFSHAGPISWSAFVYTLVT